MTVYPCKAIYSFQYRAEKSARLSGRELRIAGIKSSILVMGGIFHGQEDDVFKYDLNPVIYDMESARSLNARAAQNGIRLKVHVKLDTGMGRVGILPGDVEAFFSSIKGCPQLQVEWTAGPSCHSRCY